MAFPLVQEEVQGDYSKAPNTTWDSIKAAGMNATASGLTGAGIDAYNIADLESRPNQKTLTVPELNTMYPGTNWTEPQKERVAKYIHQANEYKSQLANRINLADPSLVGSVGRGAVGMVGDLGTDILAGVGGGAFRATGILSGGGLGTALARGAAEGAAVMTPIEAAHVAHERMLQNDVSLTDSMSNVAFGSALGAVIEGGVHAYGKYGERANPRSPIPDEPAGPPPPTSPTSKTPAIPEPLGSGAKPEHNAAVMDLAVRQMEEGLKPNIKPLTDLYERQRQGMGPPPEVDYSGRSSYEHTPMDVSNPVTAELFHGNKSGSEDFHGLNFEDNVNSMDDFGHGVYGNDNAMKANGYAAGGIVHSYEIKGKKLFAMDLPTAPGAKAMEAALLSAEFNMGNFAKELAEGKTTGREIYANLTDFGKDKMNAVLKAAGFDGLHFDDAASDGSQKSNGVMMFDHNSAEPTGAYNADQNLVSKLTPEEKAALVNADADPSRELGYDPQREDAIADLKEKVLAEKPDDQAKSDTDAKLADMKLKGMEENGLLTEAHKKEWDEINSAMNERANKSKQTMQSLFDCIVEH